MAEKTKVILAAEANQAPILAVTPVRFKEVGKLPEAMFAEQQDTLITTVLRWVNSGGGTLVTREAWRLV
ncbi:hypothetical protein [Deinococcus fonticola]|uniref:hypothetical protein n=1 Tax=Deinococcus fonticola TaxID=2528713 RepID=UPI001074F009|nr:hypothetical protein [Deinococcus fonticola]